MDTVARTVLRVTLAGAGIAVLGASYVGHASADEPPAPSPDSAATIVTDLPAMPQQD